MKLNLGCGGNKMDGYVNVDRSTVGGPDQVVDLEAFPWPWPDSTATDVVLNHVLEHLGGEPPVFLRIIQELYRICANGALLEINVPHPRHDFYLGDPTHVRPITPQMMQLFDRRLNEQWMRGQSANSLLAMQLGVDLSLESVTYSIDEPYMGQLQRGEISQSAFEEVLRERNNVASEIRMLLRARK